MKQREPGVGVGRVRGEKSIERPRKKEKMGRKVSKANAALDLVGN
jgi:hypothetical protein